MLRSPRRRSLRAALTGIGALALAAVGAVAVPTAADASTMDVEGIDLTWSLNDESNWSSFQPGAYNYLSAGVVAKTSASDVVTEDEWMQNDGNVSVEKEQPDGTYAAATWAGLSTNVDGDPLLAPYLGSNGPSGNRLRLADGSGTIDPENDNAAITWDGSFSVIFYSGLTQWYATDLKLEITESTGWLTATLGGYGTSMEDASKFVQLDEVENVRLAQLSNVDVTEKGFEVTPDYAVQTIENTDGSTTRAKSWPSDFVAFQNLTGQSSYWYASGGSSDARKAPNELQVTVAEASEPTLTPTITSIDADKGTVSVTCTAASFPANVMLNLFVVPADLDLTTTPPNAQMVSGTSIVVSDSDGNANGSPDGCSLSMTVSKMSADTSYQIVAWGNSYLSSSYAFVAAAPIVFTQEQWSTIFPGADLPGETPAPEPTETSTPEPTETSTPEPTETSEPEPTETAAPEPTETAAPEPTETAAPEPTEPEATETAAPEPTETAAPEPTETTAPEPTETAAPEPTETAAPEPTEPEATETSEPEATETAAPEPTETAAPEPTETTAPEPTETAAPEPTEPEATETAAPEPTETAAPEPTETAAPEPTADEASPSPTSTPAAPATSGDGLPADKEGAVTVSVDGSTATVSDLAADEWFYLYVYSTPTALGWVQADANGTASVSLPALSAGEHRLAVLDADGELVGWDGFTLADDTAAAPDAQGSDSSLSATGGDVSAIVLSVAAVSLLGGLSLVVARRRADRR